MVFFTCCLILHTFYVFEPLPAFFNTGLEGAKSATLTDFAPSRPRLFTPSPRLYYLHACDCRWCDWTPADVLVCNRAERTQLAVCV